MYTCPMHPEVKSETPGRCPKCGMKLIVQSAKLKVEKSQSQNDSYMSLIVVVSLLFLVASAITFRDVMTGGFVLTQTISYIMIGFFLVFGAFKLMDLRGFADGYATYDLLAQRAYSYGLVYPFIELFFGFSMILFPENIWVLLTEFVVMAFSGVGVGIKLLKKEKFQCSCLGTFLKVPLTKVTLVEDFGMAALALLMIVLIFQQ